MFPECPHECCFQQPVLTKLLHVVMSVVHRVSCCTKNSSRSKPVALFIQVCFHPKGKWVITWLEQHAKYHTKYGNASRTTVVDNRRIVVLTQLKVERVWLARKTCKMMTELDVSQVTGMIKMWKWLQRSVCTDRQLHVWIMVRN
jgi:hypothetical protein